MCIIIITSRSGAMRRNGSTGRRKVTRVKSIYLLNFDVQQEILTKTVKTQKTEQAMHCSVTGRVPFIARYCILIHVWLRIEKC